METSSHPSNWTVLWQCLSNTLAALDLTWTQRNDCTTWAEMAVVMVVVMVVVGVVAVVGVVYFR